MLRIMPRQRNLVLNVAGLSVRRGDTLILDAVSWRVERGEHWVILGANGSGKTSLLSVLAGYLTPSDGGISVLGRRFGETDWRELRKRIGLVSSALRQMMPEAEPALETVISGKTAMIDYWGPTTRSDRTHARRILHQIECGYLADRPWGVLSQGERQRVLIGRALMARPRLMILDEPCAGLDPAAREHFLQFLDRLGRKRAAPALVLVTHHVEEITPVFTHALLLKEGRLLAAGPKRKVLSSLSLSRALNCRVNLRSRAGRYLLRVAAKSKSVV